jgi:regulation of enolase protein 1 (concanavalin A-like superfamily)
MLHNVWGQDPVNMEYKNVNVSEQELGQAKSKKNKFTVLFDMPGMMFVAGKNKWMETNILHTLGARFDYNFSEIMSLGLYVWSWLG